MLSNPLYALGEFTLARDHMEQSIALSDPQKDNHLMMSCLSFAAWTLWYLGYPDQALKRSQEALALVEGLSPPFSRAYALVCAAKFYLLRREEPLARERAEEVITLSTEQGFPYWLANGTIYRGRALAEQGQGERGIEQLDQGLAAMQAIGSEYSRPYYLALLAEAYGKGGQVEEGHTVLAEALVVVDKTGERVSEAELYRLKGGLTLQKFQVSGSKFQVQESLKSEVRGPELEAEEYFLKAIEIARRQQAKSLELRAVMSLSRLWQQQGKKEEARQMLAEIYGWFTEGFDTKDLQEAKALLEELGG
jgi:predicted ATPase